MIIEEEKKDIFLFQPESKDNIVYIIKIIDVFFFLVSYLIMVCFVAIHSNFSISNIWIVLLQRYNLLMHTSLQSEEHGGTKEKKVEFLLKIITNVTKISFKVWVRSV